MFLFRARRPFDGAALQKIIEWTIFLSTGLSAFLKMNSAEDSDHMPTKLFFNLHFWEVIVFGFIKSGYSSREFPICFHFDSSYLIRSMGQRHISIQCKTRIHDLNTSMGPPSIDALSTSLFCFMGRPSVAPNLAMNFTAKKKTKLGIFVGRSKRRHRPCWEVGRGRWLKFDATFPKFLARKVWDVWPLDVSTYGMQYVLWEQDGTAVVAHKARRLCTRVASARCVCGVSVGGRTTSLLRPSVGCVIEREIGSEIGALEKDQAPPIRKPKSAELPTLCAHRGETIVGPHGVAAHRHRTVGATARATDRPTDRPTDRRIDVLKNCWWRFKMAACPAKERDSPHAELAVAAVNFSRKHHASKATNSASKSTESSSSINVAHTVHKRHQKKVNLHIPSTFTTYTLHSSLIQLDWG